MSSLGKRFDQRVRERVDPDRPVPVYVNVLLLLGAALLLLVAIARFAQGYLLGGLVQLTFCAVSVFFAQWQLRHGRRFMFASTERRLRQQLAENDRARREAGETT